MHAPTRHSLIAGVTESLREAIASGEFRDHLPGVRHLGRELCVSVPTILEAIKVLENEGRILVKQGCPTRILSSPEEGGSASTAGNKKAILLGFSPVSSNDLVFRDVIDRLRKQGYVVETHQFGSWKYPVSELERLLALHPSAGWVLLGGPPSAQEFFASRKLSCLVACGMSQDGSQLPDFEMDFSAVYRHVAHQFLNLGHRRFHLILGKPSAKKNPACLESFVSAVQEREPGRKPEDLIKTYDGSAEQLKSMLASLFSEPEKPTGLCVALVSRYILTQGWLLSEGFRIPKDVSLVCRDADELMDCIIPSPSYYAYSVKIYARRLARAIATLLETGRVKQHTLLLPEFTKGDSMGPAPAPVKKKTKSQSR